MLKVVYVLGDLGINKYFQVPWPYDVAGFVSR